MDELDRHLEPFEVLVDRCLPDERLLAATQTTEQHPLRHRHELSILLQRPHVHGGAAASSTADYTESVETTLTTFWNSNR